MFGVTALGREYCQPTIKFRFALEDYVQALTWADETLVASSILENVVRIDVRGVTDTKLLCQHRGGCLSLSQSNKTKIVASGGQDGVVNIVDVARAEIISSLKLGDAWVGSLFWSPKGTYLGAAIGKSVFILSPKGEILNELENHPSTVTAIAWSKDEKSLVTSHYAGISVWFPKAKLPKQQFRFQGSLLSVAWQPKGKYIAVGSQDATVQFWDLKTGEQSYMQGYATKVRELAWSCDSRWLATSGGPTATVWDFAGRGPQGSLPITLLGHLDFLTRIQFHPKKNLLATAGQDGRVHLFEPETSDEPIAQIESDVEIGALSFSSNGDELAFGDADGLITIIDTSETALGAYRAA